MKPRTLRSVLLAAGLTLGLAALMCCDSPPHRGREPGTAGPIDPQPGAAEPSPAVADSPPTAEPATPPVDEAEPPPPADAGLTASAPADQPLELPDYLAVLERFHNTEPPRVHFQITAPNGLVIDTRNVRRLWIDRDKLPLNTRRSIILRLDDQGIEWTADSTTVEFERSVNGAWMPVKRRKP